MLSNILTAPCLKSHNVAIDIFRAFFSVWVLCSHLIPWSIAAGQNDQILLVLNEGFQLLVSIFQKFDALHPAVLGFIVLSGYCIHRNGLRENSIDLASYFYKRFFRIIPVFLCACALGVFLLLNWSDADLIVYLSGGQELSAGANLVRLFGIPVFYPVLYPEIFQGNAPILTVMVEIWLYLLYPIWFFVLRRYGSSVFFVSLLSVFAFGISLQLYLNEPVWFQTSSIYKFALYWWIGAYFVSLESNVLYTRSIIVCLSIYIAACILNINHFLVVELLHIGMALIFGFIFRLSEDKQLGGIIINAFSWIGKISYSLYAIHAPVIIICLYSGLSWRYTFLVALTFSYFSYKLIEAPTTKLGRQLASR